MKNINVSRILRIIWQQEGISRIEIAKKLNLDKSTITNIVSDLLKRGLVKEMIEGSSSSHGGRRPIYLTINKNYGCVGGIEIQPNYYSAVVIDINGNVLFSIVKKCNISSNNLLKILPKIIDNIILKVSSKKIDLIGIGIAFSGILNPEKGIILKSLPMQIKEPLNINASLEYNIPIFIENDANCCAWAELTFQKSLKLKNFIFVLIEMREEEIVNERYGSIAVGLSIVLNSRVHYGSDFSCGEFRSIFAKSKGLSQFSLSNEQLIKINQDKGIFTKFANELSEHLAILVNTLNINHIILSSFNVIYKNDLIPILYNKIQDNFPYPSKVNCNIEYSSFDDNAVKYGAACMLLQRLFAQPEIPMEYEGEEIKDLRLIAKI